MFVECRRLINRIRDTAHARNRPLMHRELVCPSQNSDEPYTVALHRFSAPLLFTAAIHRYSAPLLYTAVIHRCSAPLLHPDVVHRCSSPLLYIVSQHRCSARLLRTAALHRFSTPLLSSCSPPLIYTVLYTSVLLTDPNYCDLFDSLCTLLELKLMKSLD